MALTVTEIMGFIDSALTSVAKNSFEGLAQAYGGTVTALLTLAIVLMGALQAIGWLHISQQRLANIIGKAAFVFLVGLSWPNFSYLYEALTNGTAALSFNLITATGGGGSTDPTAAMQVFVNSTQKVSSEVIKAESSITRGLMGWAMYCLLAALGAVYVLVAGFAKLMLAALVSVAPLAAAMLFFRPTATMFTSWLNAVLGYAFYPVAVGAIVGFIANLAGLVADGSDDSQLIGITGFVMVIVVGIVALASVSSLATSITGQVGLANADSAVRKLAQKGIDLASGGAAPLARRAGQFASGAVRGGRTSQQYDFDTKRGTASDQKWAAMGGRVSQGVMDRVKRRQQTRLMIEDMRNRVEAPPKPRTEFRPGRTTRPTRKPK